MMKAIILAAGLGQRMRPLTDCIPKPLLPVGKITLIEYHIQALAKAGIKEIIINISYHPEQFLEKLGDGSRYGVNITYSREPEQDPLEVGGGIFQALPLLGNAPFIGVSADLWTDYSFIDLPQTLSGLAHLVLVDNPYHHQKGDYSLKDNHVILPQEKTYNFAGIGVYDPKLWQDCKAGKFQIAPLFISAIKKNLITGEYYNGIWKNIGTVKQLQDLNKNPLIFEP